MTAESLKTKLSYFWPCGAAAGTLVGATAGWLAGGVAGSAFGVASGLLIGCLIGAICDAMTTIRAQIEGGARVESPAAEMGWIVLSVVGGLIGTAGAVWGAMFGMLFGALVGSLVGALVIIRKQADALEERPVHVNSERLQTIRDSSLSLPRVNPAMYPTLATRVGAPVSCHTSAILSDL